MIAVICAISKRILKLMPFVIIHACIIHRYTHTHTCVRTYIMYTHTYIHIHTHIHMHIHTHTHTYTHLPRRAAASMCLSGHNGAVNLKTAGAVITTDKPCGYHIQYIIAIVCFYTCNYLFIFLCFCIFIHSFSLYLLRLFNFCLCLLILYL